jgi:mono/diheme cytochrome c family protein
MRRSAWMPGWALAAATAAAGFALAFPLGGCGEGEERPAPTVSPSPAPPPREAPAAAPVPTAPAAPSGPPDASRGAAVYATYCAGCHGATGNGDGPLAAALNPPPAKHSDGTYMNTLSDEHLYRVIREGGAAVGKSPLMAAWGGTLSEAQIRDVAAFVRSLADPPYEP